MSFVYTHASLGGWAAPGSRLQKFGAVDNQRPAIKHREEGSAKGNGI